MSNRPLYLTVSSAYPGEGFTVEQVYKKIGGKVYVNYQTNPGAFQNTCTLRMCYGFNRGGVKIPYIRNQTGSGSDGAWYIYRVRIFAEYMKDQYGNPDIEGNSQSLFTGKKGIIQFHVSQWRDATGHFTFWDGSKALYGDYFSQSDKVSLWVLE